MKRLLVALALLVSGSALAQISNPPTWNPPQPPVPIGTSGQVLTVQPAGTLAFAAAGGGTCPAGTTGQVQYNSAGACAASANLTYATATSVLTTTGFDANNTSAAANQKNVQSYLDTGGNFFIVSKNDSGVLSTTDQFNIFRTGTGIFGVGAACPSVGSAFCGFGYADSAGLGESFAIGGGDMFFQSPSGPVVKYTCNVDTACLSSFVTISGLATQNGQVYECINAAGTTAAGALITGAPTSGVSCIISTGDLIQYSGFTSAPLCLGTGTTTFLCADTSQVIHIGGITSGFTLTSATATLPTTIVKGPLESAAGTQFTVASGTGTCATTSTLHGGVQAGDFICTTAGTAASTVTLTLAASAAAYTCWGRDVTTPTTVTQTGVISTTSVTLTLTSVTQNNVIQFGCLGY